MISGAGVEALSANCHMECYATAAEQRLQLEIKAIFLLDVTRMLYVVHNLDLESIEVHCA